MIFGWGPILSLACELALGSVAINGAGIATAQGQNTESIGGEITMANMQDDALADLGGEWTVSKLAFAELSPEAKITLNFAPDTLSGFAACNTYSVNISVIGTELRLGEIEVNTRDCPQEMEEAQGAFLRMLERSNGFVIDADGLRLTSQGIDLIWAHR